MPDGEPGAEASERVGVAGVVQAAMTIADAEGLDAVTMQSVAASLGTTKMAPYRYVPGRAELTALMLDRALGTATPDPGDGWRAGLTAWAQAHHGRCLDRSWAVELAQRPHQPGPGELSWYEAGLTAMGALPLGGAEKLDLLALLVGHVMSLVRQQPAGPAPEDALVAGIAAILGQHATDYPNVVAAFTDESHPAELGTRLRARPDSRRGGRARCDPELRSASPCHPTASRPAPRGSEAGASTVRALAGPAGRRRLAAGCCTIPEHSPACAGAHPTRASVTMTAKIAATMPSVARGTMPTRYAGTGASR